MRIGFNAQLVRRENHGVGNVILQLAHALVRGLGDAELVLYGGDAALWRALLGSDPDGERVRIAPHRARTRATRIAWEQLVLPRLAGRHRLDVFHATGYVMPLALRVPSVLSVYDVLALERPELCRRATRWHYAAALPASIRRARHVIVPSHDVRERLSARFGLSPQRVSVIPPGIHERFRSEASDAERRRVRERYALDAPFVLGVGRREPKKNFARLAEAHRLARTRGLEGELVLVGGPGWGVAQASLGSARCLGHVPDADLAVLYRLANEVAFTCLAEGFGLPVIEALASGAALVASDLPSVAESDPEAVVRVDARSVDSIAEGLLRARQQGPSRERASAAARPFTWERAAAATLRVYREVAQA